MTDIRLERPFLKQIRPGDVLVPESDRAKRMIVRACPDSSGAMGFGDASIENPTGMFTPLIPDGYGRVIGYTRVPLEEY